MKNVEFRQNLEKYAQSLRLLIENQVLGFSKNDLPQETRLKKIQALDFAFFVQTYFPHYIRHKHFSNLHKYLFDKLPKILQEKTSQNLAIAAPRGEAKSTLVSRLFTLFCIITEQKKFAVIVMDSIDQAYPMLEAIKAELEFNVRLKTDFPKICGQGKVWQSGSFVSKNNVKVMVAGSGKKLRGLTHGAYRPDLVILDDIENDEQVRNPQQRDKLENWFKSTITPLGAAGEKLDIVYIGTILHYDSVLNRTLQNKAFVGKIFQAIEKLPDNLKLWDEFDAIFKNDGKKQALDFYSKHKKELDKGAKVSWQARSLLDLMIIRATIGQASFDAEYQNDPVSLDSAPLAKSLHFYNSLPSNLVYYASLDPSMGRSNTNSDPSAIVIGGLDLQTSKLYIVEADIKRRLPDKIIEDVIFYQQEYNCFAWFIETVAFQAFLYQEILRRAGERGILIPARPFVPNTDKTLRIESLQPYLANEQILLNNNLTSLIQQLRHFPKAAHDDGADALQMLFDGVQKQGRLGNFEIQFAQNNFKRFRDR